MSSASAIVRASIGLGRDLGLNTIAEGVEDAHALDVVTQFGCDEIQGFYVSRPLPAAEFMRWVNEWDPAFVGRVAGKRSTEARNDGGADSGTLSGMVAAGR